MTAVDVFAGEICGVGSMLGVRAVIGRWPVSPFGPVADAMVEDAAGRRVFIAEHEALAAYVSSIYAFDDVIIGPVDCERAPDRLRFRGGPLRLDVALGGRDTLGWALHAVPRRVATNERWIALTDGLARVLLRGVRTRGATPGGTELYAATDRHRVRAISGTWNGSDLGGLRAVDPPVRFGFSSTPRRPSIVEVTTTVRRNGSTLPADLARFLNALAAIDAANAGDPSEVHGEPLARYEGRTAHRWVVRLDPRAPEAVQLAARAHHLRRWELPRASYPEGRAGYLRWRRDQQRRHADDLSALLTAHGYDAASIERTATILHKRGLESDPDVQLFEDAVALTFLQSQLTATRAKLADDDKLVEVLRKTLAKMSDRGRAAARTVDVSDAIAPLLARATSPQ